MSAAGRKRLTDEKRYRTTGGGDLYNLFCETALALAKPDGGVVTLIVPLSIAFGRNKQTLRNIFNQRSKTISLRHYDNNPGRTFTDSPTVRDIRNNQRITIVTVVLGNVQSPAIISMGLQRWQTHERELCIQQRPTTELLKLDSGVNTSITDQWARIPTKEIAGMVRAIATQKNTIGSYIAKDGQTIAFPKTARYFISSLPLGTVSPRSESLFTLANENHLRLAMAALNGHVAYGWWRVYGDGFHLNAYELTTITIPDAWAENPQSAIALGQRLIDAMPDCITRHPREGVDWLNVDFHTYAPALVEELDRAHITALGLPVEPLLTHLRIMRSSSSWNYPPA